MSNVDQREADLIINSFTREIDDLKGHLDRMDDYNKERTNNLCSKLTSHMKDSADYKKRQAQIIDKLFDLTSKNSQRYGALETLMTSHLSEHDKKDKENLLKSVVGGGVTGSILGAAAMFHEQVIDKLVR